MSRIQSVPMFNPDLDGKIDIEVLQQCNPCCDRDGCHAAGTQERAHLFLGVRIKGSFPEMFELKNE